METIIIHIKEKRDIKAVKSFLSTIKSAKVIKGNVINDLIDDLIITDNSLIINDLEIQKNKVEKLTNFEEGTYKNGDKPSDFVSHKTPIEEDEAEKQYQQLRKKVWRLK